MTSTNLAQWEELITKAIDNVNNGVVITDPNMPDNPIIYVNKGFERITGYTKEEVIGKNCRFMNKDDDQQPGLQQTREAIKQGTSVHVILNNYKANNEPFTNELYITPVKDATGKITHFIGIQNDITKQQQAQQELETYKEYLERLVDERTKKVLLTNKNLQREIDERRKSQEEITRLYEELNNSHKELKTKITRKNKQQLTNKEQATLLALIEKPLASAAQLSAHTKVSLSTTLSIKKRLQQKNMYSQSYIPSPLLKELGIMTLITYDTPHTTPTKQDLNTNVRIINDHPLIIYSATNERAGIIILLTPTWTSAQQQTIRLTQELELNEQHYRLVNTLHIDLQTATIQRYFDHDARLHTRLGTPSTQMIHNAQKPHATLSEIDKRVLYGLITYPSRTIKELSKKLTISMPTLIKHKKKLLAQQLIIPRITPNPQVTNERILVLEHHTLTSHKQRIRPRTELLDITTPTDHISIALYTDYRELREAADTCEYCASSHLLREYSIKLPLETLNNYKQSFSGVIKQALLTKV